MQKIDYLINNNIRQHDKICPRYERMHSEIFNPIEQERLQIHLEKAIGSIVTISRHKTALDYGCGTGNITRHLLEKGLNVVSADVSEKFLAIVRQRYLKTGLLSTARVNGINLNELKNNYFDITAAYSVLHHIPDYLEIIREMVRVTKIGGVIYIDHEENENYWDNDKSYAEFLRLALPGRERNKYKKYLHMSTYINKVRRTIEPHYTPEGDIHTLPNDHIQWGRIEKILLSEGCELIMKEDYLVYRPEYKKDIYDKFKKICSDYRLLAVRKKLTFENR